MSDHEQEQTDEPQLELSPQELEKQEEAKLKAKYAVPGNPGGPPGRLVVGHSAFLQKRLAKGQKFFDSGDYQMAKQKSGGINKPTTKVPGHCPSQQPERLFLHQKQYPQEKHR
ncbi:hypothetical protein NQ318_003360 [Aromia moschata]|uniref:cAMP-regulated phosphoprotein 19 n=1 Tax=Aromia moschata TaxID=1265417 RepID=A0AAV8YBZ5_9CUCU|nr:hypothetical protein NQ318_003360 [Aromia moschata]